MSIVLPALPEAEVLYAELLRQLRPSITPETCVVGIMTGGAWLAERLHRELGVTQPMGVLDISFYRDDFDQTGLSRNVKPSNIPFDVQGRRLLLVDDVLYTGRTVRAAMNELFDYGRPARIDLAVLVDRGGRELPVAAQFCGGTLEVPSEQVLVLDRNKTGSFSLSLSSSHRARSQSTN
jgi:pyrimidine operon attenuation protein/uracil phosphoribosyltransferase